MASLGIRDEINYISELRKLSDYHFQAAVRCTQK